MVDHEKTIVERGFLLNSAREASDSIIVQFGILYSRNLSLSSKYNFDRPCNTMVDHAQTLESEIQVEVIKVYLEETSKLLKSLSKETS